MNTYSTVAFNSCGIVGNSADGEPTRTRSVLCRSDFHRRGSFIFVDPKKMKLI